jgi:hypothetical protein
VALLTARNAIEFVDLRTVPSLPSAAAVAEFRYIRGASLSLSLSLFLSPFLSLLLSFSFSLYCSSLRPITGGAIYQSHFCGTEPPHL